MQLRPSLHAMQSRIPSRSSSSSLSACMRQTPRRSRPGRQRPRLAPERQRRTCPGWIARRRTPRQPPREAGRQRHGRERINAARTPVDGAQAARSGQAVALHCPGGTARRGRAAHSRVRQQALPHLAVRGDARRRFSRATAHGAQGGQARRGLPAQLRVLAGRLSGLHLRQNEVVLPAAAPNLSGCS